MKSTGRWSPWRAFPDPLARGVLVAPFGPGCYELRRCDSGRLVLYGQGGNVAFRMTSLLPASRGGRGTRFNSAKRSYVAKHLHRIVYRTLACTDRAGAVTAEQELRRDRRRYLFRT